MKLIKISTLVNEIRRSSRPIIEYIPVNFAFLSLSSAPNDFVYCMPDQTSDQTANRAPKEIAPLAMRIIISFTQSIEAGVFPGSMEGVSFAQSVRNWVALHHTLQS
jgi:hypothetical protein